MDALHALKLQIDWGADEALEDHPLDRRAAAAPAPIADAVADAQPEARLPSPPVPLAAPSPLARAQALAEGAADRAALQAALASFDGCALSATATNLVFAEGDPASGLVLVADVPGAAEDRAGTPFAGPGGLFLDRMLASIGLDRSHVFMTSLIPWRPPGDRKPTETEVQLCLPFFLRHLALLQPKRVVLFGALAARTLLTGTGRRPRRVWHTMAVPGLPPVPTLALPTPSHIQATPTAKRDAWGDLLLLRRTLDDGRMNIDSA